MAYRDDIAALGPDHYWIFDGDFSPQLGGISLSNSGLATNGPALCEDTTNSVYCNGTNDNASGNTGSQSVTNNLMYVGWFMLSDFQRPPIRIVGDGNATLCFQIAAGFGNSLQFDAVRTGENVAVVGNQILVPNRPYCLAIEITSSNQLIGYVDGIVQTITEDDQLAGNLGSRTGNFRLGGSTGGGAFRIGESTGFVVVSGVNAYYNHWAVYEGGLPSAAQVRTEHFEKGALADVTVTNQTELDALANTLRPNVPCCIRVTGNGTIDLSANNITFDPLASIHVQYTGTGTLNWTNTNGSNASIGAATGGGTINFINPATLTINNLVSGGELRIYDDETPGDGQYNTELDGVESVTGTSYNFAHSGATNDIVIQHLDPSIEEIKENFTLSSQDQTLNLVQIPETNT